MSCEHYHEHRQDITPDVILKSMVEHNAHHFQELEELSVTLPEAVKSAILSAVAELKDGNRKLEDALKLLEEV